MKTPGVWSETFRPLRADLKVLVRSLAVGLTVSVFTVPAQAAWKYATILSGASWFQDFGLPTAWIGVLKTPEATSFLGLQYYFHFWPFIQNCIFWTAISLALFFMHRTICGKLPYALLPIYVLGLSMARIQLEFQMAVSAMGAMVAFARIDPFSYAHITSYFAMALLLFAATIAVISRLPFMQILRLSALGLGIILLPPFVDNYVLRKPLIYNFFGPEFYRGGVSLLKYVGVVSTGIRLEMAIVAISTLAYLVYRTRSILRSGLAVLSVFVLFVFVTTPVITSSLNLALSQPQLFAGYLILTFVLAVVSFGLAKPMLGRTILRRIRLRGIHFPAMALFGSFLTHPGILVSGTPGDYGVIIVATFIVILVWQTATVFDDIYDRGQRDSISGYLPYGMLTGLMALLSAIPFGPLPWLLTLMAVYLAMDYPRLRRKHYLLSGVIIGVGSSSAFLFGSLAPLSGPASSQPIELIALAVFALFSGGSLLKDIASIEEDKRSGIETVFTKFELRTALPIVATFVAAGCVLPILFLNTALDLALFLAVASGVWLLTVSMRAKSYKPVLILYFVEGLWVFLRVFII